MKPQNFPEKLVWYSLVGTYGLYLLGANYIAMSIVIWVLAFYLFKKLWQQNYNTPNNEKIIITPTIWVWIISMLVMEVSLIAAHIDFDLGIGKIVTSSINWARTWAYLALFPLIGCLKIRPQLIYRAICIICLQSLIFIPLCYIASQLHLPNILYNSPLHLIGGNSSLMYNVALYGFEEETNQIRLQLFTPWAPALGLTGCIYFFLANQESDRKWRFIGIIGSIAMILSSFSRLSMLCLAIVPCFSWLIGNFIKPKVQILSGIICFVAGIFATKLINFIQDFKEQFSKVRASSSRIREILGRVALERWNEAPIWGHGFVDPKGPAIATFMPIGSHHTWFGILFEKGLVGAFSLLFPFLWSLIDLIHKYHKIHTAKVSLSILLVLFFFTFGENIETLAYLYWPGLLIMGMAFKEKI
ncbi:MULTISPECIES: O-antigen ligase family protein [unclassified Tolypothrix]|uniref:O-antigen ligase family protein n=1 Tax=unclassified Tolypothrix TaxID=2649714 RepID=UPI0005EAB4EC|nr:MULTISPECIES: O-antigen ligase family protein [unclassified Tolypothrix]BAY92006.1 hypothetical protein NIES3275_40370 [Microchaete diplosiphon NIES-3275]EKF04802.1 hypothetical protein FDUTEX481_00960 [Tolypothrix sp. PCC 7601]MBE9085885.1 O-antigen ligase family protein [Tolypothrix sp. LEGE 11397]UYD25996.1 O-antigen ligase family protein [Tolypothrix sp. PCC 7712]UYD31764.1 O-antigen ligase family protein [Tolypothrix sp. PCC 7601]